MKKLLIIPAIAAGLVALASPASAHTPTISAKCQTLSIDLKWYESATVTVTIDGQATTEKFEGDWSDTFTGTKTWSVSVDDRGKKYDFTQSGTFEDCAPPSTTVPTTTTAPVETPLDVVKASANTTAWFGYECDTPEPTAWVQFINTGDADDTGHVSTRSFRIPAHGRAQVTLTGLGNGVFLMGPVAVDAGAIVVNNAPEANGLGDVQITCASSAVLNRQVVGQPVTQLAFTGPGQVRVLSMVAAVLIFVGAMSIALGRKAV
jgi:hypothetical protein